MANWEYQKYHSSPRMKAERVIRNRNRRRAEHGGLVRKGDGKEVDHKNMNPMDNRASNIRVVPKKVNRTKQPKRKLR